MHGSAGIFGHPTGGTLPAFGPAAATMSARDALTEALAGLRRALGFDRVELLLRDHAGVEQLLGLTHLGGRAACGSGAHMRDSMAAPPSADNSQGGATRVAGPRRLRS
jgi:hypothetical protein